MKNVYFTKLYSWNPRSNGSVHFEMVFREAIQTCFPIWYTKTLHKNDSCLFVIISFLFYSSIYTCQENLRTQWFLIGWAWRFYFPIFKESSYLEVFTEAVMPYTGMNPSLPWWICGEVPVTFRSFSKAYFPLLPPTLQLDGWRIAFGVYLLSCNRKLEHAQSVLIWTFFKTVNFP